MILFYNCKINLGLNVLRKRADGYHDLETVMVPVRGLCDVVELLHTTAVGSVKYSSSGLVVEGSADDNLCVRAYRAVQRRFPDLGGVRIHLHKVIPMGAGLGGGSADAAAVIRGLNDLFRLGMDTETMESVAAEVGSDVPFFIANRTALARGRGEVLEPIELPLKGYQLLVVKPDVWVSTAEAYAGVTPAEPAVELSELLARPIEQWKAEVRNDFEPSIFRKFPELARIKEQLYESGALYASMSGSGTALYAIFDPSTAVSSEFSGAFTHLEVME